MENNIKAVILAAGKGTRMKSALPKVLHKIFGKTLVQRVIDSTSKVDNLSEIFVIVGHQSDEVTAYIDETYKNTGLKISAVLQQPQLGTGDAVFRVHDKLQGYKGTILILCGDTPLLTTDTLNNFYRQHKDSQASLTVMSALVDNPTNYGRIVRDNNSSLSKIVEEKDATSEEKQINEVNAGVYCIEWDKVSPAFFDLTTNNEQGEYYLTDIVDWTVKNGLKAQSYILNNNDEIFGINSKEHLATAAKKLNSSTVKKLLNNGVSIIDPENTWISPETEVLADTVIYPGSYIEGENSFGENNVIGPNTYISGNVKTGSNVQIIQSKVSDAVIADNSTVGPFAHIRGGVRIDENVRVGNFVEVKKSEINKSTNIAHLSYIGDAVLGENVNIGAGTITANYNALTKEKSKTIIEDGVKVGSNSVLVAPLTVFKDANIAAGSVITKDVPEGSLAIARGKQKNLENWVIAKQNKLTNNE